LPYQAIKVFLSKETHNTSTYLNAVFKSSFVVLSSSQSGMKAMASLANQEVNPSNQGDTYPAPKQRQLNPW